MMLSCTSARKSLQFQCSSASRKFLNKDKECIWFSPHCVSVLFSEPKIPQSYRLPLPRRATARFQCSSASRKFLNWTGATLSARSTGVSVLFSEPKIPQSANSRSAHARMTSFSALQRAENSSIIDASIETPQQRLKFQCSSASRKFLNPPHQHTV